MAEMVICPRCYYVYPHGGKCKKCGYKSEERIVISTQGRGGGKNETMALDTLRKAVEKLKNESKIKEAIEHIGTFRYTAPIFEQSVPKGKTKFGETSCYFDGKLESNHMYDALLYNIHGWNHLNKLEKKMQKPDYDFKVSAEELFDVLEVSNELSRSNYALYVRTAQVKDPKVNCILIHRSIIRKAKLLWPLIWCHSDNGFLVIASFNMIPLEDNNFQVNLTSVVTKKVVMDWINSVKNASLPKDWRTDIPGMDGITINVKQLK